MLSCNLSVERCGGQGFRATGAGQLIRSIALRPVIPCAPHSGAAQRHREAIEAWPFKGGRDRSPPTTVIPASWRSRASHGRPGPTPRCANASGAAECRALAAMVGEGTRSAIVVHPEPGLDSVAWIPFCSGMTSNKRPALHSASPVVVLCAPAAQRGAAQTRDLAVGSSISGKIPALAFARPG
jgi:hypothetical protein